MNELKPVLIAVALGFIASMSYGVAFDALTLSPSLDETFSQSSASETSPNN